MTYMYMTAVDNIYTFLICSLSSALHLLMRLFTKLCVLKYTRK